MASGGRITPCSEDGHGTYGVDCFHAAARPDRATRCMRLLAARVGLELGRRARFETPDWTRKLLAAGDRPPSPAGVPTWSGDRLVLRGVDLGRRLSPDAVGFMCGTGVIRRVRLG